ncbi:MAG: ComEC/Rec2 family competence protein [Spirochaetia bacterium]|nr:ComEC/Rec2 family competence protein [Spirochaetia bacterium]
MFSLSIFVSCILTILLLNGYFFILIVILPLVAYLVAIEYIQFSAYPELLTFYLLAGFIIGVTHGYITYHEYIHKTHSKGDVFKSARLIGISPSSITVEIQADTSLFERIKIVRPQYNNQNKNEKLYLFDRIDFVCSQWKFKKQDDIYNRLERLQAVSSICVDSKIYFKKPVSRSFNILRDQIQVWADQKLDLLGEKSYARGFLLSETKNINSVELNVFRKMGIAHLFSASGLHMGFLYATFFLPLSFVGMKKTGTLLGLIVCFFYLCLLDFHIPLLRSFFFLLAYVVLKLINRNSNSRYILYLTIIFLELVFPLSSFSPSFILSFLITLSILLFYPQLAKIITFKNRFLSENLALTISASIGSSFLSLYIFHYFHPISIIYNFILVPFSGPYLASVFIYFFIPQLKYIIWTGDYLYRKSAWLHYLLFEKNAPMIHFRFTEIWLLFFLFLTLFLIFHSIKKQYWYLRKYYIKSYFMLSMFFFLNYIFLQIPVFGAVAFPYGVIQYKNGNYYIAGRAADFYMDNFKYLMENQNLPFKKIFAPDSFQTLLHESIIHPDYKILNDDRTETHNMVSLNENCYIFIYRIQPQKKYLRNIYSCKSIFIVHSKRISPDIFLWKNFFSAFSFHGDVQLMTYFNWNWEYKNEKNR